MTGFGGAIAAQQRLADSPLVSVVVPTDGSRPEVVDAVRSVLADSEDGIPVEIIVVADGVRSDYIDAAVGSDPRVTLVSGPVAMGAAYCRNEGVRRACGRVVAFLDDDDLWLAGRAKALNQYMDDEGFVLASYVRRTRLHVVDVVPDRPPAPGEHLSEFLFRRGLRSRSSFLQTSGLAASRDVALAVGFRPLLSRHQDYDFLLRAVYEHSAVFHFVDEVTAEWRVDQPRGSAFRHPSWMTSRAWCVSNPAIFSARGRGSFLASVVGEAAAAEGRRWIALRCAVESMVRGRPSLAEVLLAFYWPVRGRRRSK